MTGWLIIVDRLSDLPAGAARHPTMTTRDYIMQPRATRRPAPKVLNLSRSYGYQTLGYYCSLLAEARGHKVVVGGELFSDAMGKDDTPEGTYAGMIRHNVDTIVKALQ